MGERLDKVKRWATTYDRDRERRQWRKIKRGARAAGGGFVGLARRAYEGVRPKNISVVKFSLFLLVAVIAHILVEIRTDHIFTPDRVFVHAIMAFLLVPLLLEIRFRDHFEELFSAFMVALFTPAILMWMAKGISWAGVAWHTTIFSYITHIFFVPIWIYYAALQEHSDPVWNGHSIKQTISSIIWVFWTLLIIIGAMQHMPDLEDKFIFGAISPEYKEWGKEKLEEFPETAKGLGKVFVDKVAELFRKPIRYAVGDDYYLGQVEKNKKEKLGVYIENVRPASPQYYQDEPVSVWGTLKARTLQPDNTVQVVTECIAQSANNVPGLQNRIVGDANPENPTSIQFGYEVANFEHVDLSCEFAAGRLKPGTRKIIFNTTFDFHTDSYLKAYFMDKERLRSLERQKINPLDQYGITDKKPIAVYTNGPVGIGMETTRTEHGSLVPTASGTMFRHGITIENKWQGKIQQLKKVVFKVPVGMSVVPDSCDFHAEIVECRASVPECEDGKYSSIYHVAQRSKRVPGGSVTKRGLDVINRLFATKKRKFVSFNCRVLFDNVETVLGNTPIATHYFKTSVDYTYGIEQSTNVHVRKVKEFITPEGIGLSEPIEPYEVPPSDEQMLQKIWNTYKQDIIDAHEATGVPKSVIIALIGAESRGDRLAVSSTGAAGLAQFTYKTKHFTKVTKTCCKREAGENGPHWCVKERKRCGKNRWCAAGNYACTPDPSSPQYDDRFDARHSIFSLAEKIKKEVNGYKKYAARLEFALASYNMGGRPVRAAIAQTSKGNPSWPDVASEFSAALLSSNGYDGWPWDSLQKKSKNVIKYVNKIKAYRDTVEPLVEGTT